MEIGQFFIIIGAVIIANLVCVFFALAGWLSIKHAESGGTDDTLPLKVYLGLICPAPFLLLAAHYL